MKLEGVDGVEKKAEENEVQGNRDGLMVWRSDGSDAKGRMTCPISHETKRRGKRGGKNP